MNARNSDCDYFRNTRNGSNKRKYAHNTCVGENCDDRGCDCDDKATVILNKPHICKTKYSIYQFTNHADISFVAGGSSIINIKELM